MSWFWLIPLLVVMIGTGFLPGVFFLLVAWQIFLTPFVASWTQYLVLGCIGLSIPLAAYLAGLILDLQSLGAVKARCFSTLAWALALLLVLNSYEMVGFVDAAMAVLQGSAQTAPELVALRYLNAVLYTAALIACVLLLAELLIEFPLHWISRLSGRVLDFRLPALRPLVLTVVIALSFDFILRLAGAALWPAVVLGGVR